MSDDVLNDAPEEHADDAAIVAEVEELTRPEADKDRDKVKNALITAKRELRAANRRIKEIEPVATRAADIDRRLNEAMPYVNAMVNNPRLKAEALRISQGTRPSGDATDQPDDDPDAQGYAEDAGFYLADGTTPDAARARRVLDRLDKRQAGRTADAIRPFAGLAVNQQVEQNIRAITAMTDADGVPYATEESIREAVAALKDGQHLLANQQVAQVILRNAIGEDRFKGRTPKAPDEPIYMPHAGGGRRPKDPAMGADQKARLAKLGLTEKDYNDTATKWDSAHPRRGITFNE